MKKHLLSFMVLLGLGFGPVVGNALRADAAPVTRAVVRAGNEDKMLVVYPNPSAGIVHLTINNQEGKKVELSILNVIGSIVYRETLTELNDRYTKTLDLSKFANGLYYVKLEVAGASQMCKLVIR